MSASDKDELQFYVIPENFIDESRIVKGMFRTRYFVEGVFMAIIVAFLANLIPTDSIASKISVMIIFCGPFFILGVQGINGDPVSVFTVNAWTWFKNRGVMLYNESARALAMSPLDAMMDAEPMGDKLIDYFHRLMLQRQASRSGERLVEGENFIFAEDKDLAGIHLDEMIEDDEEEAAPAQDAEPEVFIVDVDTSNQKGPQELAEIKLDFDFGDIGSLDFIPPSTDKTIPPATEPKVKGSSEPPKPNANEQNGSSMPVAKKGGWHE